MRVSSPTGTDSTLPALATGSTETLETSSIASPMMRQSLGAVDQVGPRNIWICRNDPHFATSATLHAGNDPTSWRLNNSFHAVPCLFFPFRPRPWLQWQRRLPRNPVLQDAPILTWNHHRWERKHISKFCARNVTTRPNKHEKKAYSPYILQQIIFHAFGAANLSDTWNERISLVFRQINDVAKKYPNPTNSIMAILWDSFWIQCQLLLWCTGKLGTNCHDSDVRQRFISLCFGHNKVSFARKKFSKPFGI